MPIQPNQVVTIHYTVKDEDGQILDTTKNQEPFSYLSGRNQILPKLEEKINEMVIGSKAETTLAPEDGYGEYREDAVQTIKRSEFPENTELKEGMRFMANTPDGRQMPLTIKEIDGDNVTIDFNHALAGKTLTFDIQLVDVRDATQEELEHGHAHGTGGHHH
ncbi:MAG: peptidylprolyl isomerase [Calditrichia bacterium]